MNYKRILKTGLLAIAATIAFAIFAYRAAEWSKGLNSEMIVLGQGSNNPGGGTGGCSTSKIIPQLAMGSLDGGISKYTTIMQLVNTSGVAQNITANFYNDDGAPLTNATFTAGPASITNGVLASTAIAKDSVLVIKGGGTNTPLVLGWGKITYCGGLTIATFFELREGKTDLLLSRVGVAASPANMQSFVIPRVREVGVGLDAGFALVNTASTAQNLTVELKDASGNTVPGGSTTINFGPGGHVVKFANNIFPTVNDGTERVYQYLKFTSNSPSFAAIALGIEGGSLASFPVDALQ
jgi:hypothetical protein